MRCLGEAEAALLGERQALVDQTFCALHCWVRRGRVWLRVVGVRVRVCVRVCVLEFDLGDRRDCRCGLRIVRGRRRDLRFCRQLKSDFRLVVHCSRVDRSFA